MLRGIIRPGRRARKRALSTGVTLALFLSMTIAGLASANTGSISMSQDCSTGEVHVFLNNNVSADRKITVTSTIPGFTSTDITDKSYNTTGNSGPVEIWSASGPQPFAGTVTLTIKYSNGSTEASYSKTLTAQDPCPEPGFSVKKGVSSSADGPFAASLTTTTGTTVYYRITLTNTGSVALTGVTLSDSTFDLAAKGCTVPTTLAVDAHYDCDYSMVVAECQTVNTATGDTDQTESAHDSATVKADPCGGVEAETDQPTGPPTDIVGSTDTNQPGSGLPLFLAMLGVGIVGVGLVTKVPASKRSRNRR